MRVGEHLACGALAILLMVSLASCGGSDGPDPGPAVAQADPVACANLPAAFKADNVGLTSATEVAEATSNGVTTGYKEAS